MQKETYSVTGSKGDFSTILIITSLFLFPLDIIKTHCAPVIFVVINITYTSESKYSVFLCTSKYTSCILFLEQIHIHNLYTTEYTKIYICIGCSLIPVLQVEITADVDNCHPVLFLLSTFGC